MSEKKRRFGWVLKYFFFSDIIIVLLGVGGVAGVYLVLFEGPSPPQSLLSDYAPTVC